MLEAMRIEPVDPEEVDERTRAVLRAQAESWGAPLHNHLLYARRPSIFRGARVMGRHRCVRPD